MRLIMWETDAKNDNSQGFLGLPSANAISFFKISRIYEQMEKALPVDTPWKIEIAEAVLELRAQGEALSLVSILSQLRLRANNAPERKILTDRALGVLLRDQGEVGDRSDAF